VSKLPRLVRVARGEKEAVHGTELRPSSPRAGVAQLKDPVAQLKTASLPFRARAFAKIAVPTRTRVAPSSIAIGKSPLIPMES
jgi:hypothetical protein